MAKYDKNWWFGEHSLYQKTGADHIISSSIFKSGLGGFWTGIFDGISSFLPGWSSRNDSDGKQIQSVIQGVPNWMLGLGIVYLAMRK